MTRTLTATDGQQRYGIAYDDGDELIVAKDIQTSVYAGEMDQVIGVKLLNQLNDRCAAESKRIDRRRLIRPALTLAGYVTVFIAASLVNNGAVTGWRQLAYALCWCVVGGIIFGRRQ